MQVGGGWVGLGGGGGGDINSISQPSAAEFPFQPIFCPNPSSVSIFQFRWRKSRFPGEGKTNPIFPLRPLASSPCSKGYSTGWLDDGRVNMQNIRCLIIFPQTRRFRRCRCSNIYNTPKKIQPIRYTKGVVYSTLLHLTFASCASRVALRTVLVTVFPMGWL